jgi:opacity protein-like surface antigen
MKSKLFIAAAAFGLCAFSSLADTITTTTTTHTSWWSQRTHYEANCDKYNANELQLDMFGTYSHAIAHFDDIFDHSWRHGRWGGGVGMNYFFTKYIGIGVDTFFQEKGHFFNNVSGDVFARLPIANSGFAPYIFGGAGWRDGSSVLGSGHAIDELTAHGGVGLEYRFNPHLGVFIDSRYTWTDKTSDESLTRAGFRIGLN